MSEQTPIKTLQDVHTWLGTLRTGAEVDVGSSLFDPTATLVRRLFEMLPGSDPIGLTIAGVDSGKALLSGAATVLGETGTTATFQFTQPSADLLCELTLQLPESLEWSLLSKLDVSFGKLTATLAPNRELGMVDMSLAATVSAGSTNPLSLPIRLSIPSFDGDWLLSAGEAKVPNLSTEALTAIAGSHDLTSILPAELIDLSKFVLTGFELAFDPLADTCSLIRIGIQYGTPGSPAWRFFGDGFTVDSIDLEFEVLEPFTDPTLQARLYAQMQIEGGPPFDVGGQFPDKAVFAQLAPGSQLSVTNTFRFFGVDLPSGFPDVEISRLGFTFYTANDAFDFQLGIDHSVKIIGDVQLDSFFFEVAGAYQTGKGITGSGTLGGQFTIGTTHLLLTGSYASGAGLQLSARATDIHIHDLIEKLKDDFKIGSVPGPIEELELDSIGASLDTGTKRFTFDCEAKTTIAGVDVDFNPSVVVTEGSDGFSGTFDGTLVLHAPGKDLTFKYSFVDQRAGTSITADFEDPGQGLQFADLAAALGFEPPPTPQGLALGLTSVRFSYSFTNGVLVLEAASTYGKAVLVVLKGTTWSFFLGIEIDRKIGLGDVPLIGHELAGVASVSVDQIQVLISSSLDAQTAKLMNAELAKLGDGYPQVPADGMSDVALAMVFDAGGEKTTLTLAAPVPSKKAELAAPSVRHLGGPPATTGATDPQAPPPSPTEGTVWITTQKSFGPLTLQKVGIRYRDSVLYFLMSASVSGGGLTIAVMGLGVGSPLTTFETHFTIDGLAITYASGPVQLSGALVGTIDPINFYGELILGVEQLEIAALGGYCEVEGHPSFFLYAVLDYPIGGPAFFFVTGLAAGFGFNRKLVIPPVDAVAGFPLVKWAQGTGNPPPMDTNSIADAVTKVIGELSSSGVVAPSVGDDWLAVGVKFTSFELVQSFALLIVEFGTRFEVALLGISTVQVPPAPADPVALAELEIEATFVPSEGILSISGQLTPQSFVLSRDCHLTGGFALSTWFAGEHEGEFVLTLGGYSPRFQPPSYYPVVPRLGLNWQVTSELAIAGDLYFALTSSAVMAGGRLSAVWQSGDIRAWFEVEADFLIVFEPFHYYITVGIHLGASFTVKLFFTSIKLNIHIGVDLEIWGPEFAGRATIDLSIISFTITFNGGSPDPKTKISWDEFLGKLIPGRSAATTTARLGQDGAEIHQPATDLPTDSTTPAVVQIVVQSGLVKRLSDKEGELNWVLGGEQLQLVTQSAIPTKDWTFSPNITLASPAPAPNTDFGVGPVGVASDDLTSTHEITISSSEDSAFHAAPVLGNVPTALWQTRQFDRNGVPVGVDPLKSTTLDGVAVGFTITPFVTPPDHTLPIPIENLQYTIVDPIKPFTWTDAIAPQTDPFTSQTVWETIAASGPSAVRAQLVTAIAGEGWSVPTELDVSELATKAAYDLVANPALRLLGEQR